MKPGDRPCPHGMGQAKYCVACMDEGGVGGPDLPPVTVIQGPISAQYMAECPGCTEDILPGDRIVKLSTDRWVHDREHCRT